MQARLRSAAIRFADSLGRSAPIFWRSLLGVVVGLLLVASNGVFAQTDNDAARNTNAKSGQDAEAGEDASGGEAARESRDPWRFDANVVYAERESGNLLADVYVPRGDGPFPGVLLIHGGAWVAGSKWHIARHARALASSGYVVMSINYRLAPKHIFPAQLDDCRDALFWMHDHADKYHIDRQRIATYGYSAGGHLACLLGLQSDDERPAKDAATENETDDESLDEAAGNGGDSPNAADAPAADDAPKPADSPDVAGKRPRATPRVQAVVAGGAPCDFRQIPKRSGAMSFFLGGTRAEKPDAYVAASPAAFASADDPPVFFFHGGGDTLVPLQGAERLSDSLQQHGVTSRVHVIGGKGHIAAFLDGDARDKAVSFLDEVLKPRGDEPTPNESAERP